MKKAIGHIGQPIEHKCATKKESLSGYEMTDEYRDAVIADIKSDMAFALSISKMNSNADTINLIFNSLGGIGPAICEKILALCYRHNALFFIEGAEPKGVRVAIFKKLSNAKIDAQYNKLFN